MIMYEITDEKNEDKIAYFKSKKYAEQFVEANDDLNIKIVEIFYDKLDIFELDDISYL